MTQRIFLDKGIRGLNNVRIGAEIFLHQKNLCPRMMLLKLKQRLRISCTESVNTLVLISYHKKIFRSGCQQRNDRMLDFGSVLGLIHTDIWILILKIL